MNCLKCNSPMTSEDMFCPQCGTPAPKPKPAYNRNYAPAPKNNTGLIVTIIIISALIICLIIAAVTFIYLDKNASQVADTPGSVYSTPIFNSAVGSSTRSYDVDSSTGQVIYYYDDYVIDNDMSTAWTPNRNTDPIPSITLYGNGKQTVRGIKMTNGYCKSENTYTKNKRVAKVRITYSGGEVIKEFGANHYREMIDIPFTAVAETDYITIQVLDTYYGEWNDIAISEIDVY